MNILDIILLVLLTLAAVDGWRRGVIVQACGVAGLVIGIWLAMRFSHSMTQWIHAGETFSTILGFIVILTVSILVLGAVGFLFKHIFRLTGFGLVDHLGGLLLGILKIGLLLFFMTAAFGRMNRQVNIIKPEKIAESKVYGTLGKVTDAVFPFLIKTKERLFTDALPQTHRDKPVTEK